MTTSVLKQDPNTENIKRNGIYYDKAQHANFRDKPPFFHAAKQHLNNSFTVKKRNVGCLFPFG